jgi:hypothetical protein
MLASITVILHTPALFWGLLFCIALGGATFLAAIHLCRVKGLGVATLKYVLTMICVEAASTVFMILLAPAEFLSNYKAISSLNAVVGFILFWILVYEAKWIIAHPRIKELKESWSSKCQSQKIN